MTGRLAPQFATVRTCLYTAGIVVERIDACAALSVIERHVQEMETQGYECAHEHRWWMSGAEPRRCPVCGTITFAALPAREEGAA